MNPGKGGSSHRLNIKFLYSIKKIGSQLFHYCIICTYFSWICYLHFLCIQNLRIISFDIHFYLLWLFILTVNETQDKFVRNLLNKRIFSSRSEPAFVTISAFFIFLKSNLKKRRRSGAMLFFSWCDFFQDIIRPEECRAPEKISRLADVSVLTPWGRARQVNNVDEIKRYTYTWVVPPRWKFSDFLHIKGLSRQTYIDA